MANKDLDTRGLGARDLGTKYFFASCINGSEIIFNIRRLDQEAEASWSSLRLLKIISLRLMWRKSSREEY